MKYLITDTNLNGNICDIAIDNKKIAEVGQKLSRDGFDLIDGSGTIALQGLVDLHTHLREPGKEDAETVATGSLAAARGGFTAVSAMANTSPVADTAGVVEQVFRLGQECGLTAVYPIGAVTKGLEGKELSEIGRASCRERV